MLSYQQIKPKKERASEQTYPVIFKINCLTRYDKFSQKNLGLCSKCWRQNAGFSIISNYLNSGRISAGKIY